MTSHKIFPISKVPRKENIFCTSDVRFMHSTKTSGWGTNHFAERWWGKKTVSTFKIGDEIFPNCAKLSSAQVPRIKNDRFLITKITSVSSNVSAVQCTKSWMLCKFDFQSRAVAKLQNSLLFLQS